MEYDGMNVLDIKKMLCRDMYLHISGQEKPSENSAPPNQTKELRQLLIHAHNYNVEDKHG